MSSPPRNSSRDRARTAQNGKGCREQTCFGVRILRLAGEKASQRSKDWRCGAKVENREAPMAKWRRSSAATGSQCVPGTRRRSLRTRRCKNQTATGRLSVVEGPTSPARSRFQMDFESRASKTGEDDECASCSIHQKQRRQWTPDRRVARYRRHHARSGSKLRTSRNAPFCAGCDALRGTKRKNVRVLRQWP